MIGRPRLRPALGWVFGAMGLVLSVSACFLLAPFLGGSRAFWVLAPPYIQISAWAFGIRRQLAGWENLPKDLREGTRPAVFIGNHSSLFDPPLMISTLPSHPIFVAKRELARVPFLGWVIWLADFIFIDRGHRQASLRSMKVAADRIRAGQSIVAFPEGTRSRDGQLLPFKKGPFALAFEAGVPVVPFAIHGGMDVLPKGTWRVKGAPYRITVGQPLDSSEYPHVEALRGAAEAAVREILGDGRSAESGFTTEIREPHREEHRETTPRNNPGG